MQCLSTRFLLPFAWPVQSNTLLSRFGLVQTDYRHWFKNASMLSFIISVQNHRFLSFDSIRSLFEAWNITEEINGVKKVKEYHKTIMCRLSTITLHFNFVVNSLLRWIDSFICFEITKYARFGICVCMYTFYSIYSR